jgi:septal ring factor EnvC (AmiA/AmiB activator)
MISTTDTIEKIKKLEVEKQSLLLEIEELKKTLDSKAKALEIEVGDLRYEVQSLRAIINRKTESSEPVKKKKAR